MIGQLIGNRYKILQQIGKGETTWIYQAEDAPTSARVVVKVLFPQYTEDVAYLQRFIHEAKMALKLMEPRIVRVLDYGVDRGTYYLVMEQVEGRDVQRILQEDGPFSVEHTLGIIGQVAQALEHTNERGIIHSYIKPRNLMITPTGMVKLLELGIAQVHSLPSLTQTGFVGSMYYISPEQATGGRVDIRSGIYSLGIIMYEMLAGAPPFTASTPWMIVNMHISGQIVPLSQRRPDTPQEVEWLIDKALVKDPQDRFQTPRELREAVEWVSQEAQPARPREPRRADARAQRPGSGYRDIAMGDAETRRRQERATALYGRGLMHYGAREWREAKALFEEVTKLVPNFQDTETLLAVINERLG